MWQFTEAKAKLTEVVTRALSEGPQRIRRRGEEVVVISAARYDELSRTGFDEERGIWEGPPGARIRHPDPFIEHLLNGPKVEGFELPPREVDDFRNPFAWLDDPDAEIADPPGWTEEDERKAQEEGP
ncbi:MAG: type II toxin-antitoxin system prevent-host-death family antitoxin [Shimia sp.]